MAQQKAPSPSNVASSQTENSARDIAPKADKESTVDENGSSRSATEPQYEAHASADLRARIMTQMEAQQLLESLRSSKKKLPMACSGPPLDQAPTKISDEAMPDVFQC